MDLPESIERLLGRGWKIVFIVFGTLFILLLCMLYYFLMIDMTYNILTFIFVKSGWDGYAARDEFSFSKFSE